MKRPVFLVFMLCAFIAPPAFAHEVRPAYLELRQASPDTFTVLWKVPARGEGLRFALYLRLPEDCANLTDPSGMLAGGAYLERWTIRHPDALVGSTIHIDGLKQTLTDVLVRIERLDGTTQLARLVPSSPSLIVEAAPGRWQVAKTYSVLGIEHILFGIDHLLFVLALLLLVRGPWRVVKTITAFTVAHSLTLSAAVLGLVHVPIQPVEAVIALSIVFVASELIRVCRGRQSLAARYPWLVSFVFGLLHGLGFAGALWEIGLPQRAIPVALACFNIGVEIGQLLFVTLVLIAIALARRVTTREAAWAPRLAAYGIGTVAMFWCIERTLGFVL